MLNLEGKIKSLLQKRNMTQKELCQQIDMSDQNLRQIFKRDSLETKHLFNISKVLDVPISYFFDEKDLSQKIMVGTNQVSIGSQNTQAINNNAENLHALELCQQKNEALQRENELLKQMIEMLKGK